MKVMGIFRPTLGTMTTLTEVAMRAVSVVLLLLAGVQALASEEAPRSDAPVVSIETLKKIRDCVRRTTSKSHSVAPSQNQVDTHASLSDVTGTWMQLSSNTVLNFKEDTWPLIFDIEANGLLDTIDTIWCIGIMDAEGGPVDIYTDHDSDYPSLQEGLRPFECG